MASNITALQDMQQQAEIKTGLCIVKISTQRELERYLDAGLDSLYRDVFGGDPYNEKFSTDEVRDIFKSFLDKKGKIFVATDPKQDGKPVAFVTSTPLKSEFNVAAATGLPNWWVKKAAYFAEDGVAEQNRRAGISETMKKLLLDTEFADGADRVLLRTCIRNYKQISAVGKAGGVVLSKKFQDVSRNLIDGSVKTDTNAFYYFMPDETIVEKIENVRILRNESGEDVAVVGDAKLCRAGKNLLQQFGLKQEKKEWSRRIRDTYAGVSRVVFGDKLVEGREIFSGNLYFAREAPPPMPAGMII